MELDKFLQDFTKEDKYYIPKDTSHNALRHFGEQESGRFRLRYEEVLYLYNRENVPDDIETRIYFDLKNSGYNILFDGENAKIYIRTKHFNRKKAVPIGEFRRCKREDKLTVEDGKRTIVGILSWGDYSLVDITSVAVPIKNSEDRSLDKRRMRD